MPCAHTEMLKVVNNKDIRKIKVRCPVMDIVAESFCTMPCTPEALEYCNGQFVEKGRPQKAHDLTTVSPRTDRVSVPQNGSFRVTKKA